MIQPDLNHEPREFERERYRMYIKRKSDGLYHECSFRLVLGMTWVGWLNFCVLQWFGFRLYYRIDEDSSPAELECYGASLAWPMTRWYLTLRREVVIPLLLSLPSLLTLAALAWWLL